MPPNTSSTSERHGIDGGSRPWSGGGRHRHLHIFIEEHPKFLPLIGPLFLQVDRGHRELVTSALTLPEVLVVPYRTGDQLLAGRYESLLTRSRGVRVLDISRDLLRTAAQLRAATGVKTPDSLQLMAALAAGSTAFLTNDRDLPNMPGIRVVQSHSYI